MIYAVRSQRQLKENYLQIKNYTKKSFTTLYRCLQNHNDENIED